MPVAEAIRSWKDEDFLMSLSEEQKALLPENPVGNAGEDLPDDRANVAVTIFCTFPPACERTNTIACALSVKPFC